ncbi:hypothetical protein PPROV_000259300 [Pycnococcus provasolii]|uniref:Uncharacterized protein n=1 Tax=Pycnococcus provasolii TaxID=41880 RepID=A0A830HER3_9CHLO|nr:hypothetical protein PPROV_000259300 [Pycnococcus provasolii]
MEAPRLRSMLDKHAGGNFGADRDRDVSAESGVSTLLPRSRQTAASSNSACRYFGLSVLVLAFFIGAATPALLKSTSIWELYDRTSKSVSEVVGTFDFDFDFASHDDVDEPVPPTLPDLPEQGQDEPDDEMEVQDPTKPPPAPRPVATVSKASPKGAPAKGIAASKQGGGGGGVALVEIEAVKHCGVSYRPEPQTRALKEGNHKCRCTAASCEDLDNPSMTYIVHVEAKSLSTAVLQASLRKAFTSIRSHMDVNRGPSFETFVSMPAPERASTAKAVFAAFLKAAAIVEPKGKNSWEATMARSSIILYRSTTTCSHLRELLPFLVGFLGLLPCWWASGDGCYHVWWLAMIAVWFTRCQNGLYGGGGDDAHARGVCAEADASLLTCLESIEHRQLRLFLRSTIGSIVRCCPKELRGPWIAIGVVGVALQPLHASVRPSARLCAMPSHVSGVRVSGWRRFWACSMLLFGSAKSDSRKQNSKHFGREKHVLVLLAESLRILFPCPVGKDVRFPRLPVSPVLVYITYPFLQSVLQE